MGDKTARPWVPGGASRDNSQRTRIDPRTVFVARETRWDRADEATLAHALSFSDHWLAHTNSATPPQGYPRVHTLRIEIGTKTRDIDDLRTPENENRRALVQEITAVLEGSIDMLGPFELRLPTDVALLRRREGGLDDHESPVITTTTLTTGAGAIGEMMTEAYGDELLSAAARRVFRRRCVETLRTYPALRTDASEWLIRDRIRHARATGPRFVRYLDRGIAARVR